MKTVWDVLLIGVAIVAASLLAVVAFTGSLAILFSVMHLNIVKIAGVLTIVTSVVSLVIAAIWVRTTGLANIEKDLGL